MALLLRAPCNRPAAGGGAVHGQQRRGHEVRRQARWMGPAPHRSLASHQHPSSTGEWHVVLWCSWCSKAAGLVVRLSLKLCRWVHNSGVLATHPSSAIAMDPQH